MGNKYYRKATDREREASVALYKFFEQFAKLTTEGAKSDAWYIMVDSAVELSKQFPECRHTIAGIMDDIGTRAEEHAHG